MDLSKTELALRAQLAEKDAQIERLQKAYAKALLELEKLRRGLVGPKTEKFRAAEQQLSFLESLLQTFPPVGSTNEPEVADSPSPSNAPEPRKSGGQHGRRKPADLGDLEVHVLRLEPLMTAEEREQVEEIDVDKASTIEYKPGHYLRLEVHRPKYRRKGEMAGAPIEQANLLDRGLKRCLAAPSLCAHVLVQKYADHLPLHRQESIFRRAGVELARSTLSDWVQGSYSLLRHVVQAMWEDAKHCPWVGIDATGILVQDKEHCRRKSFFVLVAARDHVLYHAAEREDRFEPVALLGDYKGYVLADASAIYHELYRQNGGITEVGCWSHARRKFFEALSSDREGATRGLVLIGRLYEVNRITRNGADGDWDQARRAELAKPILAQLYDWVDEVCRSPDDKSPLRLALNYLRNHREPLERFLGDGQLRLDNNLSELSLRRQVIGRKNWLFCGSDEATHWNTTIVSLIARCELHDVEPWAYLRDVLTLLPSWPRQRAIELSPKHWASTKQRPEVGAQLAELNFLARAKPLEPRQVST